MATRHSLLLAMACIAMCPATRAHHSTPAHYDMNQRVEIEGTVTRFYWRNPHSFIFLEVTAPDGSKAEWHAEMSNTIGLTRSGWTPETIKTGDRLTVTGAPARDTSRDKLIFLRGLKRASDGFTYGQDYVAEPTR